MKGERVGKLNRNVFQSSHRLAQTHRRGDEGCPQSIQPGEVTHRCFWLGCPGRPRGLRDCRALRGVRVPVQRCCRSGRGRMGLRVQQQGRGGGAPSRGALGPSGRAPPCLPAILRTSLSGGSPYRRRRAPCPLALLTRHLGCDLTSNPVPGVRRCWVSFGMNACVSE